VAVYLYDASNKKLVLSAGTGDVGRRMMADRKVFDIDARPSIVAQAARDQQAIVIGDVSRSPVHMANPYLSLTRSEVAIPMITQGKLIGVLGLQSEQTDNFKQEDIRILNSLAEQIGVAVKNARLYEEQLFVAEELKRVDKMKSHFLSSMSHELRTPLNAIINFVHMIAKGWIGPVNQEQEELLNLTLNSSRHLLHLINDVLDVSKIQAGLLTLFVEDNVNVLEEAEAALDIVKGLADEKGLQVIRDLDLNVPRVPCDRRRVRQVLLNLISNAIKFTEKGTITLQLKKHERTLQFAVTDTGPGIPITEQELIFAPFMQTEDGGKVGQGTGLGLAISRSLVQAHGGELWVQSNYGEGASFIFTLPIDRKDAQTT
jgi:signal transduction histidine kinase